MQVQSVQYLGEEGEVVCSTWQLQQVRQLLALQDAIAVLEQYADHDNWSGVFNRQRTVQQRWKGESEGFEWAQSSLDRLQEYARVFQGVER